LETETGEASPAKLEEGDNLKDVKIKVSAAKIDVKELEEKYKITDYPLFLKSMAVLLGVIVLFFSHSFVHVNLSLAWIAIIGAMIHLLVSGIRYSILSLSLSLSLSFVPVSFALFSFAPIFLLFFSPFSVLFFSFLSSFFLFLFFFSFLIFF